MTSVCAIYGRMSSRITNIRKRWCHRLIIIGSVLALSTCCGEQDPDRRHPEGLLFWRPLKQSYSPSYAGLISPGFWIRPTGCPSGELFSSGFASPTSFSIVRRGLVTLTSASTFEWSDVIDLFRNSPTGGTVVSSVSSCADPCGRLLEASPSAEDLLTSLMLLVLLTSSVFVPVGGKCTSPCVMTSSEKAGSPLGGDNLPLGDTLPLGEGFPLGDSPPFSDSLLVWTTTCTICDDVDGVLTSPFEAVLSGWDFPAYSSSFCLSGERRMLSRNSFCRLRSRFAKFRSLMSLRSLETDNSTPAH